MIPDMGKFGFSVNTLKINPIKIITFVTNIWYF